MCRTYGPLNYDGSSGAFTMVGWVKPDNGSRQTLSGLGWGFYQVYRTSGTWTFEVYEKIENARRATFLSAATAQPAGEWHHLAFAFDVTNGGTFYVDGVAAETTGSNWATVVQSSQGDLYLGCGGDASFAAAYDEVALYSRRLTPEEVGILAAQ